MKAILLIFCVFIVGISLGLIISETVINSRMHEIIKEHNYHSQPYDVLDLFYIVNGEETPVNKATE